MRTFIWIHHFFDAMLIQLKKINKYIFLKIIRIFVRLTFQNLYLQWHVLKYHNTCHIILSNLCLFIIIFNCDSITTVKRSNIHEFSCISLLYIEYNVLDKDKALSSYSGKFNVLNFFCKIWCHTRPAPMENLTFLLLLFSCNNGMKMLPNNYKVLISAWKEIFHTQKLSRLDVTINKWNALHHIK